MIVTGITSLSGKWSKKRNQFEFSHDKNGFGLALAGVKLARGNLKVSVSLNDVSEGCAGLILDYDPDTKGGTFVSLGGWESAYAIGHFVVDEGAVARALLGRRSILVPNRTYELNVTVEGVVLSLEVDGAIVLQHRFARPLQMRQVGLYAYGTKGKVRLQNFRVEPALRKAFVVMPFREPFETFWSEVIRPIAKKCKFDAYRAKDVYRPGVIIADVIEGLESADVVIADVGSLNPEDTLRHFNPNVYYEVGYAHHAGTPVILMADERTFNGKGLPFDIHHYRCIPYTDSIAGKKTVEDALRQHLHSIP